MEAGMFDVLAICSVAVELSPGWNCVADGVQVLPTVAEMASGTWTTTPCEAVTVVALVAAKVAVLVSVWPSKDFATVSGSFTCTWTLPVVPAARPVLAGVVLGTESWNATFTVLAVTVAVTLPAPTTLG